MLERSLALGRSTLSTALVLLALATSSSASERFVFTQLAELEFEGEGPKLPLEGESWQAWFRTGFTQGLRAYAVLDVPGEVYLGTWRAASDHWSHRSETPTALAVRTSEEGTLRGRLIVANEEKHSLETFRFEVGKPADHPDARLRFFQTKAAHYDGLLASGAPGAAWFRHQRGEAHREIGQAGLNPANGAWRREPAELLDLFSGGHAIAENLDLDRTLRVATSKDATIDVNSITGVTTAALDWKALIEGKQPELDPLARLIPGDQHAVFFPSFEALTRVVDDLDSTGTTLIEAFEVRVEDQMTKDRYQKQMCLPLSTLGRFLGPTVVSSVAITGSDPFLPSGTDVAILFDCKLPDVLEKFIGMRRADAVTAGAERVSGQIWDLPYEGAVTADRAVSCYTARIESVVVVANSLQALVNVVGTGQQESSRSLAHADEYVWFRDRYKRGTEGESAFIVLTDATIRRLAGPRSRIGDARRLIAAAAMNELHARHAAAIVAGKIEVGAKAADPDFAISEDFVWDENGVRSPRYGTLRFLTPISELDVEKVSAAERDAYVEFQRSFQQRWSTFFDPIAVRLSFDAGRMRADVTVMPLTIETEYRELQNLTGTGALPPSAGDPHAGALFHFAAALNKSSHLGRMLTDVAGEPTLRRFGVDPLGWLGESFAIYGERDPWWDDVLEQGGLFEADDMDVYKLPLVLQFDVKDPLKLAGFLTALRAYVDESAPNLVKWETRSWHDVSYVCITPEEAAGLSEPGRDPHFFYAALPDMLVFSLREDLIQKSIDRRQARKDGQPVDGGERVWVGKSTAFRVDGDALHTVLGIFDGGVDRNAEAAWSTIPILNEWKRRFPNQDPVRVHERLFGVRLTTPSNKPLAWNEELQSMESPEYGTPGAPKRSTRAPSRLGNIARADFGLEFERNSLRAIVEIALER